MEKEPQVFVYPHDGSGCGMYRMIWPGEAVHKAGKPVKVLHRPKEVGFNDETTLNINVDQADVIVFQRPGWHEMPKVVSFLQERGKKVVIDMDDNLSCIPPRNAAYREFDPRISHARNHMHVSNTCELADLVTVTTQALADEYGSHGRVAIIPNYIPESYLSIPRPQNEVPIVGWAGWTHTHVNDLRATKGSMSRVLSDTGAKFAAFGDNKIFFDLGIKKQPPHENWGFTNINWYPQTLVNFDIGLVPLSKSNFNYAKSWLKGMEYASLGIVPIVTPIGDYVNLVDVGIAIPAETADDWYNRTRELILDTEMRAELSEKVRNIAANYTIEGNTHKWWSAWERAYSGVL